MAATAFAARAGTHAINAQHSNRGLQPRSLSQTSGSATKCRRTIIPGASDEKKEESMVEWVTRAIFSIFSPASSEDTAPDFTHTGTPFTGEILSPDDARRLARIEQVIGKVKSDAPEAEQQEKAQRDENLGEYLAKAASQAFKQPEAKEDEIFKNTGYSWSGTPLTPEQRRKLARVEQVVSTAKTEVEKTLDEMEKSYDEGEGQ